MTSIPLVDLHAQYLALQGPIDAAIRRVVQSTTFIGGPIVREFEESYAADYGVRHCVSVANGTDALYVALKMLGIGPGDEVITTAHSWISTSETISQCGARCVFVDVDAYYTIDPELIERAITPRTRAIVPVHLYGQPADMTRIMAIANKHGLVVIEDCAQAHYAEWRGQRVGTFGVVGTFSFFPGKNLGAYGDAGAIITNDDALAIKMRMYANHGALRKHEHAMEGINSRLDTLQAAILQVKLPHVHEWTAQRQRVASWYDEMLSTCPGVTVPLVRDHATHVYHLYVVQVSQRDAVAHRLAAHGVHTAVHYPTPLPLLEAYRHLGAKPATYPLAAANCARILSLPMYPELTRAQVEFITRTLASAAAEPTSKAS
jgi:dTDP-4-amino-4,6-dideoxygalactose transaminase